MLVAPVPAGASDKALRTQLEVDTRSLFLSYSHASEGPADVTFNVKDLRCLLALCEHMGANISLLFDTAGMPLLAEPHFRGTHVSGAAESVLLHGVCCLLAMCEHMGANISLLFDAAGMPLLAEPHFRGTL